MPKITILDELTANQIAAGEVVERPASVVKELVENSLDAGADAIEIDIYKGGLKSITINDNGSGMPEEDAVLAFSRHATSKITSAEDLTSINTLGFRGEALPSIASIAKVVLKTRSVDSVSGTKVEISGGKTLSVGSTGCPPGTSVTVNDLFFNTPARYKHLQSPSAEAAKISDLVNRLAMAKPEVSFRLRHNDKNVFYAPGTGNLLDAVAAVYGIKIARELIPVTGEDPLLTVSGYTGKPSVNRGSRKQQTLFINHRLVKSSIILRAIEEAYRTILPVGRYSLTVLALEINPESVDVNVHPAKLEVRVEQENEIAEFIKETVKKALKTHSLIPEMKISATVRQKNIEKEPYQEKFDFSAEKPLKPLDLEHKESLPEVSKSILPALPVQLHEKTTAYKNPIVREKQQIETAFVEDISANKSIGQAKVPDSNSIIGNKNILSSTVNDNSGTIDNNKIINKNITSNNVPDKQNIIGSVKAVPDKRNTTFPDLWPLAQLMPTYILASGEKGLYIIDQHAAHERILFEKYQKQFSEGQASSQMLLVPITLELGLREEELLIKHIILLTEIGFIVEEFGKATFLLRGVPGNVSPGQEKELFFDILDFSEDCLIGKEALVQRLAAAMACKTAIKASEKLTLSAMQALAEQLAETESPYTCPHGRPTLIHLSQEELAGKFKR